MPITYDITKDSFYTEGMKEDVEKERLKNQKRHLSMIRQLLAIGKTDKQIMQTLFFSLEEYQRLKNLL